MEIDRKQMINNLIDLFPIFNEENLPTVMVDHTNGINFIGLKARWGNGKLDQSFDVIEKYLSDHPGQQTFYVTDIALSVDFENLPALCVAMQAMAEDGLAHEYYQVMSPDPELFKELEDIPEKYREYDLKMLYVFPERLVSK